MANEFESKEQLHYRTQRSTYLQSSTKHILTELNEAHTWWLIVRRTWTHFQAGRESFAECVVHAFKSGQSKASTQHWVCGIPEHAEAVGNCKEFHPNCKRSCHQVNIVFSELVLLGEDMHWFIIDWHNTWFIIDWSIKVKEGRQKERSRKQMY